MNEEAYEFNDSKNWYYSNDTVNLNQKKISNILYFNLTHPEFDILNGNFCNFENKSDFKFSKNETLLFLEEEMKWGYLNSHDYKMKIAVSVFASFVFLLPVFMNSFGWFAIKFKLVRDCDFIEFCVNSKHSIE